MLNFLHYNVNVILLHVKFALFMIIMYRGYGFTTIIIIVYRGYGFTTKTIQVILYPTMDHH